MPSCMSGRSLSNVKMSSTNSKKIVAFREEVWKYYRENGRHDLPWRQPSPRLRHGKQNYDPYKILVSEVMLQQTQVSRVIEKYKSFLKKFPTAKKLASARFSEVLREWSGLGYNRRGKYLYEAAKLIVGEYRGNVKEVLQHPLPGVGPYTRAAVLTFAFNEPHTFIETNIRASFIHHFFNASNLVGRPSLMRLKKVSDGELFQLIENAAEGQDPREWHWALMDYGAHLKRSGVRNNHRSKHYTKQSKFEGSLRQVRGEILRRLTRGEPPSPIRRRAEREIWEKALEGLVHDGLIVKKGTKWTIRD